MDEDRNPVGPSISPAAMAAWRAFLEAHARITGRLARELDEGCGLPLTWYDVLVQLSEVPGNRLRMGELAGRVLLSRAGFTRLVDRMAAAGLVEREPCPDDRRGFFVTLTQAGHDRLREAAPVHLQSIAVHFAAEISAAEADALRGVLSRLAARASRGGTAG